MKIEGEIKNLTRKYKPSCIGDDYTIKCEATIRHIGKYKPKIKYLF